MICQDNQINCTNLFEFMKATHALPNQPVPDTRQGIPAIGLTLRRDRLDRTLFG
jgi:hypothetical protein